MPTCAERYSELRLRLIPPAVEAMLRDMADHRTAFDQRIEQAVRDATLSRQLVPGMDARLIVALMLEDATGNNLLAAWFAMTIAQRSVGSRPDNTLPRDDAGLLLLAMRLIKAASS